MTAAQLKTVMAIFETGSVSAAAKRLGISQPSASVSISSLEEEIGFVIFSRSKAGAKPTEKGRLFLSHARRILAENENIMRINERAEMFRLRVGTVNSSAATEPFIKLCAAHRDDPETDTGIYCVSVKDGLTGLENDELDVVFAPCLKSQLTGLTEACRKKDIEMISLGRLPAVINVRNGHPAADDGRCEGITQGSDALREFPYVAYRNLSRDTTSVSYNDADFVQSKYRLYADTPDARLRLVQHTNGFAFGMRLSPAMEERYGLKSFPVPGIFLDLFCLTRQSGESRAAIDEYISLLREELEICSE